MLPNTTFFQIMSITADLVIFLFVGHYVLQLRAKEQEIEQKEKKIDNEFHEVVNDALAKERKIIEDATKEADQIIAQTHTVTQGSEATLTKALGEMQTTMKTNVSGIGGTYQAKYEESLQGITDTSLNEFRAVTKELNEGVKKQLGAFQQTLLPTMQKELDAYKQAKMKETDQMVQKIVNKVSQEVLNKTISLEDHQQLLIDSLEKAKREGIFD